MSVLTPPGAALTLHQVLDQAVLQEHLATLSNTETPLIPTQPTPSRPASALLANHIHAGALQQFYAHHHFQAQWHHPARLSALLQELDSLTHDGLEPSSYDTTFLRTALARLNSSQPAALPLAVCDELRITTLYLQALADLHHGRLRADQVEPWWRFDAGASQPSPGPSAALIAAATADLDDLSGAFQRARPSLQRYQALRTAHAELSAALAHGVSWPEIPAGPSIRPGERDPRVRLLRERLSWQQTPTAPTPQPNMEGQEESPSPLNASPAFPSATSRDLNADVYDGALQAEVEAFQTVHQLEPDGIVGRATLAALNISPKGRLAQIRADLERTRWLAREIAAVSAPRFVLVDIPSASIHYFRNGQEVWQARAQVGKPSRQTPLLRSEITHFTVNPTWTIPPTILRKDKLPAIRADIGYLARNRLRVLNHQGQELDPYTIDWSRPGPIMLRQDAGPGNALGQVAIRFPNPFAVYLHDTPSQGLFGRDQRAVSSGCVRVEHALELTQLLLQDDAHHTEQALQSTLDSRKTRNLRLTTPVPILLAYTGVADNQASSGTRADIYERDAHLLRALDRTAAMLPLSVASCSTSH